MLGWLPTGGAFVGLQPARVLDTRSSGAVGPAHQLHVTRSAASRASRPTPGLRSSTSPRPRPRAPSFVTVWPKGSPRPLASSLNTEPGQDTPNLVIAPIGADGQVSLYNNAGTGHLVADVLAYVPAGAPYVPLIPTRMLDTRVGPGPAGRVGPGQTFDVQVAGSAFVPSVGVTAVVLNVTSTDASAPSFITAWPTGQPRPNASNLNTEPGQDTPNLVIVKVGAGGRISLYNNAGTGHLVADVIGYLT